MMAIYFQITLTLEFQIKQAVEGQLFQHVIQIANPGLDIYFAAAIQVKRQLDFGFACISLFADFSHFQL